jgi:hypothetical protein
VECALHGAETVLKPHVAASFRASPIPPAAHHHDAVYLGDRPPRARPPAPRPAHIDRRTALPADEGSHVAGGAELSLGVDDRLDSLADGPLDQVARRPQVMCAGGDHHAATPGRQCPVQPSTRIPGASPARSSTQLATSKPGTWHRHRRCRARRLRSSAYFRGGFRFTRSLCLDGGPAQRADHMTAVPNSNPYRGQARSSLPRLFTATVAAYRDKPGRRSSVGVKSGRRECLGRREWFVIMGI